MSGTKPARHHEIVKDSILACPLCAQMWLAIGVAKGDSYTCKACGHRFRVGAASPAEGQPNGRPAGDSTESP
jgi:transposase-like protein